MPRLDIIRLFQLSKHRLWYQSSMYKHHGNMYLLIVSTFVTHVRTRTCMSVIHSLETIKLYHTGLYV